MLALAQWPSLKVKRLEFKALESESAEEYMDRCKREMGKSFNFKSTEGGYRDTLKLEELRKEQVEMSKKNK